MVGVGVVAICKKGDKKYMGELFLGLRLTTCEKTVRRLEQGTVLL